MTLREREEESEAKRVVAKAIQGAKIVRVYEGLFENVVTYRQWCEKCGYLLPKPPITARVLPGEEVVYATYHVDSFACPICDNRQLVQIRG